MPDPVAVVGELSIGIDHDTAADVDEFEEPISGEKISDKMHSD